MHLVELQAPHHAGVNIADKLTAGARVLSRLHAVPYGADRLAPNSSGMLPLFAQACMTTNILVIILVLFMIFCLNYIYFTYLLRKPDGNIDLLSLFWLGFMLVLPLVYLIFRLIASDSQEDYHFCSNMTKIIMLGGILYSLVFYFILKPFLP